MAKWGSFPWKTKKWGAETVGYLSWGIEIDWDNDGAFTGENEAGVATYLLIDRGRSFFLNSASNGFEPVRPGRCTIKLENIDGKYDPYNTASPLYPNVTPGKLIRVSVKPVGETKKILFTGYTDDIRPISGTNYVEITAVDKIQLYQNQSVSIDMQIGQRVSSNIEAILIASGETDYDVDSILDIIPYYWADNKRVYTAITELVDSSIGNFFVDVNGTAKYYQRVRSVASVMTIAESEILSEIEVSQPWDAIRNNIDVYVHARSVLATGDLWQLADIPAVGTGNSIEIWAEYNYNNLVTPAINVISPVVTTDYTMNTQADGLGIDLTTDFSVTSDIFGQTAKLTITNNSASDGYVTLLKIRGDAVVSLSVSNVNASDTASQLIYQKRTFSLDSDWIQSTNTALDIVNLLDTFLPTVRKYPVVQYEYRFDKQFSLDLFDRVEANINELYIDDAYRIGEIKHEWLSENGQKVRSTFRLEPVISGVSGEWTFPTEMGVTSVFA